MTVDVNGYHNNLDWTFPYCFSICVALLRTDEGSCTLNTVLLGRPRGEETDSGRQDRKNRSMMDNGQMQREGGTDVPG